MTRRGATLIELLATLAILAIVASVVTLSLPSQAPRERNAQSILADARRQAVTSRARVTVDVEHGGTRWLATAFPDGGVVADSGLEVDRLTGARRAGARP